MGWKKRAIVEQVYEELALAGFVFELSPEEMQAGMRGLDMMMAAWLELGISLGYAQALSPDSGDLDDESGVPVSAIEAVTKNLAVRLAASKGKALAPSTIATARSAYVALLSKAVRENTREQQLPVMPSGAGNRRSQPFLSGPDTEPLSDGDGGLSFGA